MASYRHNTLTRILINELNAPRIACKLKCSIEGFLRANQIFQKVVNRLDLPVSGIVICTKSGGDVAKKYCMEIMTQKVAKKYLCRVDGHFPGYVQYYPFSCQSNLI